MKCCLLCEQKVAAKGLCKTHYTKEWARIHQPKSIKAMNKKRFGGVREAVLERDGYKCLKCGMTSTEHHTRWKRELTIDHMDHKGRYSEEQNNNLDNLRTLCLRCHGHEDATIHGKYAKLS